MENLSFECPICLELFSNPISLPCGHNFCYVCKKDISIFGSKKCPVCRREYPKTDYKVNETIAYLSSFFYPKHKFENLVKIKTKSFFRSKTLMITVGLLVVAIFCLKKLQAFKVKNFKDCPFFAYQVYNKIFSGVIHLMLIFFRNL